MQSASKSTLEHAKGQEQADRATLLELGCDLERNLHKEALEALAAAAQEAEGLEGMEEEMPTVEEPNPTGDAPQPKPTESEGKRARESDMEDDGDAGSTGDLGETLETGISSKLRRTAVGPHTARGYTNGNKVLKVMKRKAIFAVRQLLEAKVISLGNMWSPAIEDLPDVRRHRRLLAGDFQCPEVDIDIRMQASFMHL